MARGVDRQAALQLRQAQERAQHHVVRFNWCSVPPGSTHECHAPPVACMLQPRNDVLRAALMRDCKDIACIEAMRLTSG